jgi:hypothetical protein
MRLFIEEVSLLTVDGPDWACHAALDNVISNDFSGTSSSTMSPTTIARARRCRAPLSKSRCLQPHRQLPPLDHATAGLPWAIHAASDLIVSLRLLEYATTRVPRAGDAIIDYVLDYDHSDMSSSGFHQIITRHAQHAFRIIGRQQLQDYPLADSPNRTKARGLLLVICTQSTSPHGKQPKWDRVYQEGYSRGQPDEGILYT